MMNRRCTGRPQNKANSPATPVGPAAEGYGPGVSYKQTQFLPMMPIRRSAFPGDLGLVQTKPISPGWARKTIGKPAPAAATRRVGLGPRGPGSGGVHKQSQWKRSPKLEVPSSKPEKRHRPGGERDARPARRSDSTAISGRPRASYSVRSGSGPQTRTVTFGKGSHRRKRAGGDPNPLNWPGASGTIVARATELIRTDRGSRTRRSTFGGPPKRR